MSERWRFREGWGILFLSFAMAMVASFGVANAGWTEGLNVVPLASLGAFVIGLMITRSLLPGWLGHMFSLVIGFAWSFRLVTTLFPDLYTAQDRWAWLWTYLYQWTMALVGGGVSHNNMVFILQMALIVWEITYLSIWFIFRSRQAWLAVVPGGVLLLVNLYYAPNDITVYLLVYLALGLLLVIRFNLFSQEQIWRRDQVHFNADEINFDFLRAGALFTLLILTLAWIAPAAVSAQETELFESLRGPWHDFQNQWGRLFASLNYRPRAGVDFSGSELNLGGPRELAEVPVLAVRAPPDARYWRAVVFDRFSGRGWENTDDVLTPFGGDNEALAMVPYLSRQPITHSVTILGPSMTVLPIATQPFWIDQAARASVSFVEVAVSTASGQMDEASRQHVDTLSYARSRVPLDAGDRYVGTALLSQASERQLRAAGADYPAWITERYLQLPDGIPERVRQLAAEIGASYDNAYDKASGVEGYLRREIAYNEKIEAPPVDRDPVDYILFDLKQAYCDYYATSMAVMLRSLGIPARVVSGYAQGEYDPDQDAYIVELQDAHTWVEVFFPNYGWIEFEPTAAQPVIARPLDTGEAGLSELGPQDTGVRPLDAELMDRKEELLDEELPGVLGDLSLPLWARLNPTKPGSWIFGSLVLIGLAGAVVWTMRRRRPVRMTSIGSIYHNMLRLSGWAGANLHPSQTPHENAAVLGRIIPEGERPAQRIAGLYTEERYGRRVAGDSEQAAANQAWHELRPRLIRKTLLRRLTGRR
jgi:transglutaminase-like putative cysteine protease